MVAIDPRYFRPTEVTQLLGDPSKARKKLGWQHRTSFETLVQVDPRYFRPTEVDILQGDATKARTVLGWKHSISFDELVRDMVEADLAAARVDNTRRAWTE